MITRNFKLFLSAGKQIPLMINVSQYDHGEKWVFTLYDDHGQKYEPSSGAIVGIKADKKGIINTGTVNSAGQVEIMETQQMTAAAGKAVFELLIDGDTHGTANFIVLVEPKPGDQADMSASDLSLLQQAINSIAIAGSGAPAVATLAADMTDEGKIYLYAGSEVGYTAGDWYYYNGASWVDGGKYGGTVDATLTQPGQAADAKKVGDEISDLKSQIAQLEAIPYGVKLAMDNMFAHATYKDYDASNDYATFHAWAGSVDLVSIDAVFTQGNRTIFTDTELDSLKNYLVVTATYSNGSTSILSDDAYVLTGQLTAGTSTITVTYDNKTDTFNVTVTEFTLPEGYTRYGYIQKKTTSDTKVPRSKFILLNTYDDLNELSLELTLGQKSSTSTSPAIFGARMGDTTATSFSLYNTSTDGFRMNARGKQVMNTTFISAKTKLEFINPAASPAYWRVNGGELHATEWTNSIVITCPIMLFNNATYTDTSTNYSLHAQARIGDMIFRTADGECVGYYIPVTYDGVIGMYDFVSETFYTASNTTVVTVADSGCLYAVGNW